MHKFIFPNIELKHEVKLVVVMLWMENKDLLCVLLTYIITIPLTSDTQMKMRLIFINYAPQDFQPRVSLS